MGLFIFSKETVDNFVDECYQIKNQILFINDTTPIPIQHANKF